MYHLDRKKMILCCFSSMLFLGSHTAISMPLTLKQAETAALSQSPEIKSSQAKSRALEQSAIAAGQFSDPKLMLGTLNVPVDTFNFSQEPMTQIQVGLQQSFPRGHSLHFRSLQKQDLSAAESESAQTMKLMVLQNVRLSWLDLYYWLNARTIILNQEKVFKHLLDVTESMLANNQAQQKDVIRAQLELSELDNRLLAVKQQSDIARANLARWIGPTLAYHAQPTRLPTWPAPGRYKQIQHEIKNHPILKTDAAYVAAGSDNVKLAKQQYKPGFTVSMAYGFRQGNDLDGSKRPDFLSAQVSMDLPIFTSNRQDKSLKESQENLLSNEENQMSDYRQLQKSMSSEYAVWQERKKSTILYQQKLTPEAKQYAEATMAAYQNAQTDFPTLARAYVRELNTELEELKEVVDQKKARVNLLYLQGK